MSAAPVLTEVLKIHLVIKAGPHNGMNLDLQKSEWLIGRGNDCDLILSEDARVSRQHAQIRVADDEVWVTNMSQKNFVLVNGVKVENSRVNPGDVVQIGDSQIEFNFKYANQLAQSPLQPLSSQPVGFAPPIASNNQPSQAVSIPTQVTRPAPISFGNTNARVPMQTQTSHQPAFYQPQAPVQHQMPFTPAQPQPSYAPPPYQGASQIDLAEEKAKRFRFFLVLLVVAGLAVYLMSNDKKKEVAAKAPFRTNAQIEIDREQSEKFKESLKERKDKMDTLQYKRAQENYIKGFRDFRQGQYARAYDSFQVVLNMDPDNELAKQYQQLARIRFDEQIKFAFLQGQRYREKKNFRMCINSFSQVMTMLQGQRENATYKEAKQYFEECSLAKEGRF